MNKVKMFFIAAALVLTTAGVFAGKAKFFGVTPTDLYYSNTGLTGSFHIGLSGISTTSPLFSETQSGSATQWTFKSTAGTTYGVYYYTGTANTYAPVYANF